jgi:hypothetical protein
MRNRPDSLFMSEARYHTTIDNLKDGSFSLDCRVGSLIENALFFPRKCCAKSFAASSSMRSNKLFKMVSSTSRET